MGEVVLLVNDYRETSHGVSYCRICHEAEFESSMSLEAPCSCSGTVKFAHRDCIQRWCNEKGNTICEICLQNYEPGYVAPSKKPQLLESMTIRDSLDIIPRRENEIEDEVEQLDVADRSASCWRLLALTLALVLLLRDILATCAEGTGDYPFTLLTILILRTSGILIPVYIVFWTIGACHKYNREQYQNSGRNIVDNFDVHVDEQLHLV